MRKSLQQGARRKRSQGFEGGSTQSEALKRPSRMWDTLIWTCALAIICSGTVAAAAISAPRDLSLSLRQQSKGTILLDVAFSLPSTLGSGEPVYHVNVSTSFGVDISGATCIASPASRTLSQSMVSNGTVSSFQVSFGCTYSATATASNDGGSNTSSAVQILAAPQPDKPMDFSAIAFFAGQLDLAWEAPLNLEQYLTLTGLNLAYTAQIATSSSFGSSIVGHIETREKQAVFPGLNSSIQYFSRVNANNCYGPGLYALAQPKYPLMRDSFPTVPSCCAVTSSPPVGQLAAGPTQQSCPGALGSVDDEAKCGYTGRFTIVPTSSTHVALKTGRILIKVRREEGFNGLASVRYQTINGSAKANIHFSPLNGKLTWLGGRGQDQTVAVPLIQNFSYTPGSYFLSLGFELFEASGADLGSGSKANFTIQNSNARGGILSMASVKISVSEANRTALVQVVRTGGSECPTSVLWSTVPSLTNNYGHYQMQQSGTLFWKEGDDSPKSVIVNIFDNQDIQGPDGEWLYVEIRAPSDDGCAMLNPTMYRTLVVVVDDDQVGILRIAASLIEPLSSQGVSAVRIDRVGGSSNPVSVNYIVEAGTARWGDDFNASNGVLLWKSGDFSSKEVTIRLNEGGIRGEMLLRTLTVRLAYVVGTRVEGPTSALIRIVDTSANSGMVGFASSFVCGSDSPKNDGAVCYYASGDQNTVRIPVSRVGGFIGDITVGYGTKNSTPMLGQKFAPVSGTLSWASYDSSMKYIDIPIFKDVKQAPIIEYMCLVLKDVGSTVAVVDHERENACVGVFEINGTGTTRITPVAEWVLGSSPSANFSVHREGGSVGSITAYYQTFQGTALSGCEYVDAAGNVTWADGDVAPKNISVSLINDGMYRYGRYITNFFVKIVNFTSNSYADPRSSSASVNIVDDNAETGYILFSGVDWDPYAKTLSVMQPITVSEGAGHVSVVVQRKAGLDGNLRVNYRTVEDTAKSGKHFVATLGSLSWPEGNVTDQIIMIPLIDDAKFNVSRARYHFRLEILNLTVSGQGLSVSTYQGPPTVSADIFIVENDGPGILEMSESFVEVSEDVGELTIKVNRIGGSAGQVSVDFATFNLYADSFNESSIPTSCEVTGSVHWQKVRASNGTIRYMYCDKSGIASLFSWRDPGVSRTLWDRQCISNPSEAPHDSSIMWADLTARVGRNSSSQTSLENFSPWQRGQNNTLSVRHLPLNTFPGATSLGDNAKPVPLPFQEAVVWFDWENQMVVLVQGTNAVIKANFSSLGITTVDQFRNASSSNLYFISNGVDIIHVGHASDQKAVLLSFNLQSGTINMSSTDALSPPSWCGTSSDAFGHMLWTVNGRVLYRNCSSLGATGRLGMILGGPINDVNSRFEYLDFYQCPVGPLFGTNITDSCGSSSWGIGVGAQTGLDIFSNVDSSGFLYFGKYDHLGGGIFGCQPRSFSSVRTEIEIARAVPSDYTAKSGSIAWDSNESSQKSIVIPIRADKSMDQRREESFGVILSSPRGVYLSPSQRKTIVTIIDSDGAGALSLVPMKSTVGEREKCCFMCEPIFSDSERRWCAYFEARRSNGNRGAVCADFSVKGSGDDAVFTANNISHFYSVDRTLCWGHMESDPKIVSVQLRYHGTYDTLFKSFGVVLSAPRDGILSNVAVGGRGIPSFNPEQPNVWEPTEGARMEPGETQMIEDEDVKGGLVSFVPDGITGLGIFQFSPMNTTATMLVQRRGGSDGELRVDFETEMVDANFADATQLPLAVKAADGSRGNNESCLADERVEGSCADSSSALQCAAGMCTVLVDVAAQRAEAAEDFSGGTAASFVKVRGTLRWADGDSSVKGISVPLLHVRDGGNQRSHRVFRVDLKTPRLDMGRMTAERFDGDLALPDENAYGGCSKILCTDIASVGVGRCSPHTCRRTDTSTSYVLVEVDIGQGSFRLINTTYFVEEGKAPDVGFSVERVGGSSGKVHVNFSTSSMAVGSISVPAIAGEEYVETTGQLTWADGERGMKEFSVSILNDGNYVKGRMKRSFRVQLTGYNGTTVFKSHQNATIIIVDDDAETGRVRIVETKKTVDENQGLVQLSVARVGGTDTDIYVQYLTGIGSRWDTVVSQGANSSAHPRFFSEQSYACLSTIKGAVTDNGWQTIRNSRGGPGGLAFDFDSKTFWDATNTDLPRMILTWEFSECVAGAAVSSYSLMSTGKNDDWCPGAWKLLGSNDGQGWTLLNQQSGKDCDPSGTSIFPVDVPFRYRFYQFAFTSDSKGRAGVKIAEVIFRFQDQGNTNLIVARMCNRRGECCQFQRGLCDASTGHTYQELLTSSHDFDYVYNVLHWADGDNTTQILTVPLTDDCMGCSQATCSEMSQFQDKVHETFHVQLIHATDVQIVSQTNDTASTFPFRKDPGLSSSPSVVTIRDDDGPGALALFALSCGSTKEPYITGPKSGSSVPPFVQDDDSIFPGLDASCPVLESAGVIGFQVTRSGQGRGAISVAYSVVGSNASAGLSPAIDGTDFEGVSGSLHWSHNDTAPKYFTVVIHAIPGYERGRYVRSVLAKLHSQQLSDGSLQSAGGAEISQCGLEVDAKGYSVCLETGKGTFEVQIVDRDAIPGTIIIKNSLLEPQVQYAVDETAGFVDVIVERVGGKDLPLTVSYFTTSMTNLPPAATACPRPECDYFPVNGTLYWDDQDDSNRTVRIQVIEDTKVEGFETFRLVISGHVSDSLPFCGGYSPFFSEDGAVLHGRQWKNLNCGTQIFSEATITIRDSLNNGYLELLYFDSPFIVPDDSDTANIAILRQGGESGIVAVQIETFLPSSASAVIGQHFSASQVQAQWYNQDSEPKVFSVPIIKRTVPSNTVVDFYVRLTWASSNTAVNQLRKQARILVRSTSFVAKFVTQKLSESSLVANEDNKISFSFKLNIVVSVGGKLTLTGLTGTRPVNSTELPIFGSASVIFGGTAIWKSDTGQLTCTVAESQQLDFGVEYSLEFVLRNKDTSQSPVVPTVALSGGMPCAGRIVNGIALSCTEQISIAPALVSAGNGVLSASLGSFQASLQSSICRYKIDQQDICKASVFFGAYNYIRIFLRPSVALPSGSHVTLSGFKSSPTPGTAVLVSLADMLVANQGVSKELQAFCECFSPKCSCGYTFTGIPRVNSARLQIHLQCNAHGWGEAQQNLNIRVGFNASYNASFPAASNPFSPPPNMCEDNCGSYHKLFSSGGLNVSDMIQDEALFISVTSGSLVDFCGRGQFLLANLTLSWITEGKDVTSVTADWHQPDGVLTFVLPEGFSIGTNYPAKLTVHMRNPETYSDGSFIGVSAETPAAAGTVKQLGPTLILKDRALVAIKRANLLWASLEESSPVQNAENLLIFQMRFNGEIGGTAEGTWVTITGLQGSATPSQPMILLSRCTVCTGASADGLSLSDFAGQVEYSTQGTGSWNNVTGELFFHLRGSPPTFVIPERNMVAMLKFTNPSEERLPSSASYQVLFSSSLAAGSGHASASPIRSGGYDGGQPVFLSSVSMQIFSRAVVEFSDLTAFMAPENITVRLSSANIFDGRDEIKIHLPMLTTCNVLCDGNICSKMGCTNISSFYVSAPHDMLMGGGNSNVFLVSWIENISSFVVQIQGGRSVCANANFELLIRWEDYECHKYSCALKLLPKRPNLVEGVPRVSTNAFGCSQGGFYCSPAETVQIETLAVDPKLSAGAAWGQFGSVHAAEDARGWFSLVEHDGLMYQLGGFEAHGVANTTRISRNGKDWQNADLPGESAVFPRIFFVSLSFDGFLYIIGGLDSEKNLVRNVVRLENGNRWFLVNEQAPWTARYDLAAVVHAGRMWIMGGASAVGLLSDVWSSLDGIHWAQSTSAAEFGGLRAHAAASFRGKMWVYGGEGESSSANRAMVWYSFDGRSWSPEESPWMKRRMAHQGIVFDSRLWVVGGYTQSLQEIPKAHSDIWWSKDGITWNLATAFAQFGERFGAVCAAFKNRLWYIGGSSIDCASDWINQGSLSSGCPGLSGLAVGNSTSAMCEGFYKTCNGSDIWGDVFSASAFVDIRMESSSPVIGADNLYTLNASLDNNMDSGDSFVITGLNCTCGPEGVILSGPSAHLFKTFGDLDEKHGTVSLVLASPLPARVPFEVSFVVTNGPTPTSWTMIQVKAVSINFFESIGTPMAFCASNAFAAPSSISADSWMGSGSNSPFDGGVAFDIEAMRSVFLKEFTVDIKRAQNEQPVHQSLSIYYHPGSITDTLYNLSEWRFLGNISIDSKDATSDYSIKLTNLVPEGRPQGNASSLGTLCGASAPNVGTCNSSSCFDSSVGPADKWPYAFQEYTFCDGETYCPHDGSRPCYCTSGHTFDCVPGSDESPQWLGPRQTWIEDTEEFVSSRFDKSIVNVVKVAGQVTPDALWHSGEPGGNESGCPDLPLCPPTWPYDKDQWLSFDMGTCHSISGFRTLHPNYTYWRTGANPRLQYTFKGVVRSNMAASSRAEEHWNNAHYKDFELQWSQVGPDGPWITAFGGRAVVKAHADGYQSFQFPPVIARYWRLLFVNNYGFGYMLTSAVEFLGLSSVWCQASEWCHRSLGCQTGATQKYAAAFSSTGGLEEHGFGISAGTHAFFIRGSLGLGIKAAEGRRGDIVSSDGRVALKLGARLDFRPPIFSWQSKEGSSGLGRIVSRQGATDSVLRNASAFVLVARFRVAVGDLSDGTLVSIGDKCAGGISLVARGNAIIVQAGTCVDGNPVIRSEKLLKLSKGTSYCYAATFKGSELTHRLERQFPMFSNNTVEWADEDMGRMAGLLDNLRSTPRVFVGASDSCGNNSFPGTMLGVSIYSGQLSEQEHVSACHRTCEEVSDDGECFTPAILKKEQRLQTSFATSVTTMRLPVVTQACHSKFRLRVSAGSKQGNGTWCLKRMFLFGDTAPHWQSIDLLGNEVRASSNRTGNEAVHAFAQGNAGHFCTSETGPGWLEISLPGRVCVSGYALQATEDVLLESPSSWVFEGNIGGGGDWLPLHSIHGSTFRQLEVKKFSLGKDHRFMFVTNMYTLIPDGMGKSLPFAYSTFSNLYKWAGDELGWTLAQQIPTRGARQSVHWAMDGEHYLAIASARDGSLLSFDPTLDGQGTDSQVGSDVHVWNGEAFMTSETIPTNVSKSLHYFQASDGEYLVSADQRMVIGGEESCLAANDIDGCRNTLAGALEDGEHSILFRKDISPSCATCACASMEYATVSSSGITSEAAAGHLIDGDYSTAWSALFNESFSASDQASSESLRASLALEISFDNCAEGSGVTGYTLVTSGDEVGCPSRWLFQAFRSGKWETLDDRSDDVPTGSWPPSAPRECPTGKSQTFQLRRLDIFTSVTSQRFRFLFFPKDVRRPRIGPLENVSLAEIELLFGNTAHQDVYGKGITVTTGYLYQADSPPFWSAYMDMDHRPVSGLIGGGNFSAGQPGDFFNVVMISNSSLIGATECNLVVPQAPGYPLPIGDVDGISPFRACSYGHDLCRMTTSNESLSICFGEGTAKGMCGQGSNNLGAMCGSDADCGGGVCVIGGRYIYKVSFKRTVRLLRVRVRGCNFCGGSISVMNSRTEILSEKLHTPGMCDIGSDACGTVRVNVHEVGTIFYIMESTTTSLSLLSAISFEYEPFGRWNIVQLIPTMGAMDFEHFTIAGESYMAVANYRTNVECYGDVGCFNPKDSQPLSVGVHLPYNVHSHVLKKVHGKYHRVQNISTFGALDWEHAVISGVHYLVVANSFDASFSTTSAFSTVYRWDGVEFQWHQSIPTQGARRWRYFLKDNLHHLVLVSSSAGMESIKIYRWDGTIFILAGKSAMEAENPTDAAPFVEGSALLVAVSSFSSAPSSIFRVCDAATWHGRVAYDDAYAPSARFVRRIINGSTLHRYSDSVLTVTLRPDRTLKPGTVITIGGILTPDRKALSETASETHLPLFGPGSVPLDRTASWNKDAGELRISVTSNMSPQIDTVFSFILRTPRLPATGSVPSISASGTVTVPRAMMIGRVLAVEKENVPEFTDRFIAESCSVRSCDYNIIRIQLRASQEMPVRTIITVRNLLGTRTKDGMLEIFGPGAARLSTSSPRYLHSGNWSKANGTFTVVLAGQALPPYEFLNFSFVLKNGQGPQSSPFPTIESSGPLNISAMTMTCALQSHQATDVSIIGGDVCPVLTFLGSPGWIEYAIADSHTKMQALNTFTVTIRPTAPLLENDEISISGLTGTPNPDSVISLGGEHAKRFQLSRLTFSASGSLVTLKVAPNCVTDCSGRDCVERTGQLCIFPFVYAGQQQVTCLSNDSPDPSKKWCSTVFSATSAPAANSTGWGYCSCSHTIPADSSTIFSFQIRNPQSPQAGVSPRISASGSITILSATMVAEAGGSGFAHVLSTETASESMKASINASARFEGFEGLEYQIELEEFTVEFWIKVVQLTGSISVVHFGSENHTSLIQATSTALQLHVNTDNFNGASKNITAFTPSETAWHHWAVTWSGGTARANWYKDGAIVVQDTLGSQGDRLHLPAGSKVLLGGSTHPGGEIPGDKLFLGDVRIWSVAQSAAAIKSRYKNFFQVKRMPAGLLAYYTFDGCNSTVCPDISLYGRHLTTSPAVPVSAMVTAMVTPSSGQFLDEYVYASARFPLLQASQTSDWPGGDNCIHLNLTVDIDIASGASFTVYGLSGSQTPTGLLNVTFSGQTTTTTLGRFDRDRGTLKISFVSILRAHEHLVVTFSVINHAEPQDAQRLSAHLFDGNVESIGDSVSLGGKASVTGSGVLFASSVPAIACTTPTPSWSGSTCPSYPIIPGQEPTCDVLCPTAAWRYYDSGIDSWLKRSLVVESEVPPRANLDTTITITLQPDRRLPAGSIITVRGLTGSQTTSRNASSSCAITAWCFVQISGQDAVSFDLTSGSWFGGSDAGSGALILTLAKAMEATRPFSFSFILLNSQTATSAGVTPSVSLSGSVPVPPIFLCLSSPLLHVASNARIFQAPTISQNICRTCRSTNISVSLKPLVDLTDGTTVTIMGLGGTLTPTGLKNLTGTHAGWFKEKKGEWNQENGTFVLFVDSPGVPAGTILGVSFVVHSGRSVQQMRQAVVSFRTPDHNESSMGQVVQVPMTGSILSFGDGHGDVFNSSWSIGIGERIASVWTPRSSVGRQPQTLFTDSMDYLSTGESMQKTVNETCCLGECCVEGTCCTCSDILGLARAGFSEFLKDTLFFSGSPCEVRCDLNVSSSSSS